MENKGEERARQRYRQCGRKKDRGKMRETERYPNHCHYPERESQTAIDPDSRVNSQHY